LQIALEIIYTVMIIAIWPVMCWSTFERTNVKGKTDTVLFFGGAVALIVMERHVSEHTLEFFAALFYTAVLVRAVSYLKLTANRDIVATLRSAIVTVKAHPLACIACVIGAYELYQSIFIVLG
jgi:hypothetical protein